MKPVARFRRRLKKLVTNPNLVFYNYFARRIGVAVVATTQPLPRLSADAPARNWQELAARFGLRSGALTGRPDASLLLDNALVRPFIAELVAASKDHQLKVELYSTHGSASRHLRHGQWTGSDNDIKVAADLADQPDFVVELSTAGQAAIAAQVFQYDRSEDRVMVRSNRAYMKRVAPACWDSAYPAPLFDAEGGLVATSDRVIDVVYTWVDKTDPGWQRLWREAFPDVAFDSDRFTSNDELLYSVRSIAKYAPWVRNIHVVTNCERPPYFAADSRIRWVDHREVFPDPSVLPVFNSHAIEACLHRVPGLSEHFIYFNDDVLLNQPAYPSDFFDEFGRTLAYLEPYGMVPPDGGGDADYLRAAKNSQLLLHSMGLNVQARQLHQHTPSAQRRGLLAELEARCPDEFAATRAARLRAPGDINLTSFLVHHYGLAKGQTIVAATHSAIVRPRNVRRLLAPRTEHGFQFLCFNDGANSSEDTQYKQAAQAYFKRRFEEPCAWELGASGEAPAADTRIGRPMQSIVYGVFDLFDERHVRLLHEASVVAPELIVGLATDELLKTLGLKAVSDYSKRKALLEACRYVRRVLPWHSADQALQDIRSLGIDALIAHPDSPPPVDVRKATHVHLSPWAESLGLPALAPESDAGAEAADDAMDEDLGVLDPAEVRSVYDALKQAPEDQRRVRKLRVEEMLKQIEQHSPPDSSNLPLVRWRFRYLNVLHRWEDANLYLGSVAASHPDLEPTRVFYEALHAERGRDHDRARALLEQLPQGGTVKWVTARQLASLRGRLETRTLSTVALGHFATGDLRQAGAEIERYLASHGVVCDHEQVAGLLRALHQVRSFDPRHSGSPADVAAPQPLLPVERVTHMMRRAVFVSGFGYSGSGAVSDFLRSHGNVIEPDYPYDEFIFLGGRYGIGSIYAVLRAADKRDVALTANRFVNFIFSAVLGLPAGISEDGHVAEIRRPSTFALSRSVLGYLVHHRKMEVQEVLAGVSRLVESVRHALQQPSATFFERIKQDLAGFVAYILLHSGWDGQQVLLLNNSLTADRLRVLELFPESKVVVVRRDPRDSFVSRVMEAGVVDRSAEANIKLFGKRYNLFMLWKRKHFVTPDNAVFVDFERFVSEEAERTRVAAALPPDLGAYSSASRFNPANSQKNIRIHSSWNDRAAIASVESELLESYEKLFA